jgi:hypothetical protein
VPDAGLDREIAAQKLANSSGFGRRFDNHQTFRTGFGSLFCHINRAVLVLIRIAWEVWDICLG